MGKAKVLHSRLKVDEAGKSHRCQHSKEHLIAKGDKRLKVTEGRTDEHYCLKCAARFLTGSIESLQCLLAQVTLALAETGPSLTGSKNAQAVVRPELDSAQMPPLSED